MRAEGRPARETSLGRRRRTLKGLQDGREESPEPTRTTGVRWGRRGQRVSSPAGAGGAGVGESPFAQGAGWSCCRPFFSPEEGVP